MRKSELEFIIELLKSRHNAFDKPIEKARIEKAIAILEVELWIHKKRWKHSKLYKFESEKNGKKTLKEMENERE